MLRIGFHGLSSGSPIGGTNFAILIGELECLHETQSFVNAATHWQVVDRDLTQFLVDIDDEEATERDASFLIQHTVGTCDVLRFIGQQWDVQAAQTALFAWCVDPCQMGEVAVGGASNDFATDLTEFLDTVGECNDFGWTNEGAANDKEKNGIIINDVLNGLIGLGWGFRGWTAE